MFETIWTTVNTQNEKVTKCKEEGDNNNNDKHKENP